MNGQSVLAFIAKLRTPIILVVSLVIACAVLSLFGGSPIQRATTEAAIYLVVVIGLYIFIGMSGVISFGHISFMLLGAYAAAWQSCCPGLKSTFMPGLPEFVQQTNVPVLPAAIIAGLLASFFAFLSGIAIMRLTGVAASIGTLALLAVMKISFENWDSITSGHSSVIGLPLYVDKWVALAWASVAIFVTWTYQNSRWGLAIRLARDDEIAARACGIRIYWQRLLAFVLSAFFVGVGGALYAHYLGTVAVDIFWLDMTFITLAMLIVGGMTSLSGAVVGVVCVTVLTELLRHLENGIVIGSMTISAPDGLQEMALAVAMLLVLVFRPNGLTGGREIGPTFGSKLLRHAETGYKAKLVHPGTSIASVRLLRPTVGDIPEDRPRAEHTDR
jgi:branched-chain amino acid transport system permease protein